VRILRGLEVSFALSNRDDVEVERDAELVITSSVGDTNFDVSATFGVCGVGPEGDVSEFVVPVHERVSELVDAVLLLVEDAHGERAVADLAVEAQEVDIVELSAAA